MNFSSNEAEEVKRLKKQIAQQDLKLSRLESERQKEKEASDLLKGEVKDLTLRIESEISKGFAYENELCKVKEDRDRQKLAVSNLEHAYNGIKGQLQEKERGKRLFEDDSERQYNRKSKSDEEELNVLRNKNRQLEEQVRSAQSSILAQEGFQSNYRRRNGDPETKLLALENEVAVLKADNERLRNQTSTSTLVSSPNSVSASGRIRRPRASSVSQTSTSELQQLREDQGESKTKLDQWEARAVKAEREALRAANEKIAASKASESLITDLKSQVIDLKDEVTFQQGHLDNLEKEVESLQVEKTRASTLPAELKACQTDCSQRDEKIKSNEVTIVDLGKTVDGLTTRLQQAVKETTLLNEQVADGNKQLQRREREIEAAKKQFRRLASSVRKTMNGVANGQVVGDETYSSTTFMGADESSLMNMTVSRDFETDWFDELEQLVGYMEDLKEPLEFAKVERSMLEKTAALERVELQRHLEITEEALHKVMVERDQQAAKYLELQAFIEELQSNNDCIEAQLEESLQETKRLQLEKEVLEKRIVGLEEELQMSSIEAEKEGAKRMALEELSGGLKAEMEECNIRLRASQAEYETVCTQRVELEEQISSLVMTLESNKVDIQTEHSCKEDLLAQIQELKAEKAANFISIQDLEVTLKQVDRDCKAARLEAMKLTLESHEMNMRYREEARESSCRLVDVISQSREALGMEGEQWLTVVEEYRRNLYESQAMLASIEKERAKEGKEYEMRLTCLNSETVTARAAIIERDQRIEALELDLQEGRMNQELAEDVLKRLIPSREGDVTINGDMSTLEPTRETFDLKSQLVEAGEAIQRWKERQELSEQKLKVALEEEEQWRVESDRLEKELRQVKLDNANSMNKRDEEVQQAEASRVEAQASMVQMEDEMMERMSSLQKMQSALQTSEEIMQRVQEERDSLNQEVKSLRVTVEEEALNRAQRTEKEASIQEEERGAALRSEVETLQQKLTILHIEKEESQEQWKKVDSRRLSLEATIDTFETENTHLTKRIEAATEKISSLELKVALLEEEKRELADKLEETDKEMEEARDGYDALKNQLQDRNDEYWETKEELAEWQERYERSQADLKIKEELNERLREAEEEMTSAKQRIRDLESNCLSIEEEAVQAQKKVEEQRLLIESLQKAESQTGKTAEIERQLVVATNLIEQLEQELTLKAQECEEADDKELALRKDNKKLAARIAALQIKVEKLQFQSSVVAKPVSLQGSSKMTACTPSSVNKSPEMKRGGMTSTGHSPPPPPPSVASRKRRAPEEEEGEEVVDGQAVLTRAIYAPKSSISAPSTAKAVVGAGGVGGARKIASLNKSEGTTTTTNPSSSAAATTTTAVASKRETPSDVIAKRLKSPGKEGTLQDRTNLQSRQATASQHPENTKGIPGQDNPFMAKLNRFRAPSGQIMTTKPTPTLRS